MSDAMMPGAFLGEVFGPAAATVRSTFRAMEIAEDEIAAAKQRHPLATAAIHEAFRILCPNELLLDAGERLYRAHCMELLDRVAANSQGADLAEPTAAELCAALSQLSLATPLSHDYVVAYGEVFRRAFPGAEPADAFDNLPESYPGRTDEVLSDVARKIHRLCQRPTMEESR